MLTVIQIAYFCISKIFHKAAGINLVQFLRFIL